MKKIEVLGEKLGPVLFQLPPKWHFNIERLQSFLKALPEDFKYAFEFRDSSWFDEKTEEALASKNAAFCIYDFEGRQSPRTATADFVYIRLHGPDGAYRGQYDDAALSDWAGAISEWESQKKEVYCYLSVYI